MFWCSLNRCDDDLIAFMGGNHFHLRKYPLKMAIGALGALLLPNNLDEFPSSI